MITRQAARRSAEKYGFQHDEIKALKWVFSTILHQVNQGRRFNPDTGICFTATSMLAESGRWPRPTRAVREPGKEALSYPDEIRDERNRMLAAVLETVENAGASWPLSRTPGIRNQSPIAWYRHEDKWEGEQRWLRTELLKHVLLWLDDKVPPPERLTFNNV